MKATCELPLCHESSAVEVIGKVSGMRLANEQTRFAVCHPHGKRLVEQGYEPADPEQQGLVASFEL